MTAKAKIAHVSTVHRRNDVRIFLKEASALASQLDAEVLFCVQDGKHDEDGDIKVISAGGYLPILHQRLTLGNWRMYKLLREIRPDIVHIHDPELILLGIAMKATGARVVLDVHEDYRQVVRGLKRRGRVTKSLFQLGITAFEWISVHLFDGVICATERIAQNFWKKGPVVVKNFPDINEMSELEPADYKNRGYNVVYVGGITEIRGVREMVLAVSEVKTEGVKLLLAGVFKPLELWDSVSQCDGWENVECSGWSDRKAVVELLSRARIGLVMLHPHGNYVDSLPTKMFEYMAAGIPVVISDFPLFRSIVEKYRCGLVADPMNPADIARAIDWLFEFPEEAQEMGRRGREAVLDELNWERESKKLVGFYRSRFGLLAKGTV